MSFVFRDPFFDAFDDYLTNSMPCYCAIDNDDEKNSAVQKNPKVRRDVITPFSGFGRMDVHENENEYEVSVDIPGMDKDDIKLSSEENKLVIEGERKSEKKEDDDKTKYHFVERHFGSFHREVCLPGNAMMDKIGAKYENGVLKISIPKEKKVESVKKQITVNSFVCCNKCVLETIINNLATHFSRDVVIFTPHKITGFKLLVHLVHPATITCIHKCRNVCRHLHLLLIEFHDAIDCLVCQCILILALQTKHATSHLRQLALLRLELVLQHTRLDARQGTRVVHAQERRQLVGDHVRSPVLLHALTQPVVQRLR